MAFPSAAQKPVVAIIGRPNVGKSTLFNRLTRSSQALVAPVAGVTRDRHYGNVTFDEQEFLLVDTGGFIAGETEGLEAGVRLQAEAAVAEADLVILVMDGRVGPQTGDEEVADYLRRTGKPLILAVNKIDTPGLEANLAEFYRFGLTPIIPLAAAHGFGVGDLLEEVAKRLPTPEEAPAPEPGIRVAILGRPNVGKSSLVNRLLGTERLMVSPQPGTTRDAIDTHLTWQDRDYILVDTAGLRRPSRIAPQGLERFMTLKALKALDRAQVAVLLLDAAEGLTQQDLRIAALILDQGKGCLICLNKWDLVEKPKAEPVLEEVGRGLKIMAYVPILPISVKTGYHVNRIFPFLEEILTQSDYRVGTGELNQIFGEITRRTPPPRYQNRQVKFFYLTQAEVRPPTFIVFVNFPQGVPDSYQRYLLASLREALNLPYSPLKLFLKRKPRKQKIRKKKREGPPL